jgi:hypothetical protein
LVAANHRRNLRWKLLQLHLPRHRGADGEGKVNAFQPVGRLTAEVEANLLTLCIREL